MKKIREDHLWDYAEGRLSGPEKADLEQWLAADPRNRRQLEEVRALSSSLGSMEAEMPSMRFTARVMEAWEPELALRTAPLKTHTDKRIVYAIAALLAVTLTGSFGLLVSLFSSGNTYLSSEQIRDAGRTLENIFAGSGHYFIGMVIILLLLLAERYLHYRNYIRSTR